MGIREYGITVIESRCEVKTNNPQRKAAFFYPAEQPPSCHFHMRKTALTQELRYKTCTAIEEGGDEDEANHSPAGSGCVGKAAPPGPGPKARTDPTVQQRAGAERSPPAGPRLPPAPR